MGVVGLANGDSRGDCSARGWSALFPAEQARILHLLVQRVTVTTEGLVVDLRTEGLGAVVHEMITPTRKKATA
jgi:site-specific DNA recombinase